MQKLNITFIHYHEIANYNTSYTFTEHLCFTYSLNFEKVKNTQELALGKSKGNSAFPVLKLFEALHKCETI